METSIATKSLSPLSLVKWSFSFFGTHVFLAFGAGLIAALGRAIQLGAIGVVSSGLNTLLEIIIEGARILTFLLVLGEGKIGKGAQRIKSIFFQSSNQWKAILSTVITKLKVDWTALVINIVIYSTIAFIVNFTIDKVAYDTELLSTLQNSRVLTPETTEWVLLLIFKNLTVIPFTIIFNGFLLLWVTNNLKQNNK